MKLPTKKILTFLMPRATRLLGKPGRVMHLMKHASHLVEDASQFDGIRRDLLTLFALLKDSLLGRYRGVSKKNLALIVAGILYLVNPMDLLPDFILGVGFLDDVSVLMMILNRLSDELDHYREFQ